MKYHAFSSYSTPNGDVVEKEFKASNWDMLREFIEAYWLNYNLSEHTWGRLLAGDVIHFPGDGTIHLEEDD